MHSMLPEATSENAVVVLQKAYRDVWNTWWMVWTILSDNGSCFVGAAGRHKKGIKTATEKA